MTVYIFDIEIIVDNIAVLCSSSTGISAVNINVSVSILSVYIYSTALFSVWYLVSSL